MSIEALYPIIKPSINIDFASTKTLDPRITFTRASTGTYYDGVTTAMAEQNFLTYSQDFSNAAWNKSVCNISGTLVTAPDGTTTAQKLIGDSSSAVRHPCFSPVFSASGTYTISFYVKAAEYSLVQIFDVGGGKYNATFDLSAVTATSVYNTTPSITSVGNGWYRCVVTTAISGNNYVSIQGYPVGASAANSGNTYNGDGTSGLYIWGAQLEQRASVTAYTPTTTQPITNYIPVLRTAQAGQARFDHNPTTGESLGLLIEEQRTNLLLYSEQFDNSYWTKGNVSIQSNTVVSPDGTLTGDKLVEDTANSTHSAYNFLGQTLTNNVTYTASVYVKAAGRTKCALMAFGGSTWGGTRRLIVDLSNGSVISTLNITSSSVTNVGNNWYRISFTATATGTTGTAGIGIYAVDDPNTFGGFGEPTYQGNGYSGIFIWGAQLEAGSFPTSYIPTVASQVTRSADAASLSSTNFSQWYNIGAGALFVEALQTGLYPSSMTATSLVSSGVSQRITMYRQGGTGAINVYSDPPPAILSLGNPGVNVFWKQMISYVNRNVAYAGQGVLAGSTMTTGFDSNILTSLTIGFLLPNTQVLNGYIKRIAYYPASVANTQLQALTV